MKSELNYKTISDVLESLKICINTYNKFANTSEGFRRISQDEENDYILYMKYDDIMHVIDAIKPKFK